MTTPAPQPIPDFGKQFLAFAQEQHGKYSAINIQSCALGAFVSSKGFVGGAVGYYEKIPYKHGEYVERYPARCYWTSVDVPSTEQTWEALTLRLEELAEDNLL